MTRFRRLVCRLPGCRRRVVFLAPGGFHAYCSRCRRVAPCRCPACRGGGARWSRRGLVELVELVARKALHEAGE